ncbi:hypothetical protein O1Q82_00384 [Lonepinella sp. MS14437]
MNMEKPFDFNTAKRPTDVAPLAKMRAIRQQHLAEQNTEQQLTDFFDPDIIAAIRNHATEQERCQANNLLRSFWHLA